MINSTLAELFKTPERYKNDGSWYHDAKKTAFALNGLSKVIEVRKIDAFPSQIYKLIINCQKEVEEYFKNMEDTYEKKLSKVKEDVCGYY